MIVKKTVASYKVEYAPGSFGELVATSQSQRLFSTFTMASDDSYDTYAIRALALKTGNLVYNPSYVVITKDVPGTDAVTSQFLKQIQNALSRFRSVKFERGNASMLDLINRATGKQYTDDPSKINIGETEKEDVLPLPKGVQIFEGGQDFTYIIDSQGNIEYTIRAVLASMERAVEPMIKNNLIDYYEIKSQVANDKFVTSENFQRKRTEMIDEESTHIGYLKYVLQSVLSRYPSLYKLFNDLLQFSGYSKVDIQNKIRIDLGKSKYIINMIDEGGTIYAKIYNSMLRMDDAQLASMENLVKKINQENLNIDSINIVIGLFDDNDRFQEEISDFQHVRGPLHLRYFLDNGVLSALEDAGYARKVDMLMSHMPAWAEQVIEYAAQGDKDARYVLQNTILPHMNMFELSDEVQEKLQVVQTKIEEQRAQEREEVERNQIVADEKKRQASLVLNFDTAYMDLRSKGRFVSMRGEDSLGKYLYDNRERLNFDWFDQDEFESRILEDAYTRASEDMGARPSEVYGDDAEEVDDDIKYYADDYLDSIEFFESEDGLQFAEDEEFDAAQFVLDNEEYRLGFIEYKKEEMRADEGDWEPDNDDINKIMAEIGIEELEQLGYDNGLMVAVLNLDTKYSVDNLTVYVSSNYLEQAKTALLEISKINAPSKYKDNINRDYEYEFYSLPVDIWIVDKNQNMKAGTVGNLRFASSWYARVYKLGGS